MRSIVVQSIKGRTCTAFNRDYISKNAEKRFETLLEEKTVEESLCDVIGVYNETFSKEKKSVGKEYDSNFNDYRKSTGKEKGNFVKKKSA